MSIDEVSFLRAAVAAERETATEHCRGIVEALDGRVDTPPPGVTAVRHACDAAARALGGRRFTTARATCTLAVSARVGCLLRSGGELGAKRCPPGTPPVTCVDGTMDAAGVRCRGENLRGGCFADPAFDATCDMAVWRVAQCEAHALEGETDALVRWSVGPYLESLLAARAKLRRLERSVDAFVARVGSFTDYQSACFGAVRDAAGEARADLREALGASDAVLAVVEER